MSAISMKAALLKRFDAVRTSFWFMPTLMGTAAVALAFGTLALDHGPVGDWVARQDLGYGGSAEGAATMLQTIASSMITIAGVVFSLTLVCLSLASSQFGPRLLRSFMSDLANQVVLGTFVATFLYCILVLRAVRRADEALFVPHLSVAVAVLLAVASLAVLVFFIHHVARSIQAEALIARVAAELHDGIETLFPARVGDGAPPEAAPRLEDAHAQPVPAEADGYVQFIDAEALMATAREADILVRVARRPGDFVMAGEMLAHVFGSASPAGEVPGRIARCFAIGSERTPAQDASFTLQQLVEIAVRALSASMNDPFTAVSCIDRIGSALRQLGQRDFPPAQRRDETGRVRVIAPHVAYADFVELALDPIRRHARGEPIVLVRIANMLASVGPCLRRAEDRQALREQALRLRAVGARVEAQEDREPIERAAEAALRAIG